ncbi:MAG: lipid-A-disaccharide synthase [Tannerellaceae bacterium]|jgi:lipid-A-disaccharide synthase|nr:lipid-A-disaccharide synthase [Tannerellaceae bacterium]
MKYYLIAGEASGDLHASDLMAELKKEDPSADFRYLGGDLMQAVGGRLVGHYRRMAFMGVGPVLLHLPEILRNMRMCREDIRRYRPDVVILVDYPGFNLKIARFVKTELNIPVCYYISPKIWAWKRYRIRDIRRYVDRMLCILPFEEDFYRSLGYPVDYVGNPSVDSVARYRHEAGAPASAPGAPVIALLAGSRRQEIKDNLPAMLEAASAYGRDYRLVVAGAPGIERSYYDLFTGGRPDVTVVSGETYALLCQSRAALVTSGTATLEAALFRVPQVVCYRTPLAWLTGFIFRRFFHTPYISLVNLIAGREIVRELFADRFSVDAIGSELGRILGDSDYRNRMLGGYDEVAGLLGEPGAARRAARLLTGWLA